MVSLENVSISEENESKIAEFISTFNAVPSTVNGTVSNVSIIDQRITHGLVELLCNHYRDSAFGLAFFSYYVQYNDFSSEILSDGKFDYRSDILENGFKKVRKRYDSFRKAAFLMQYFFGGLEKDGSKVSSAFYDGRFIEEGLIPVRFGTFEVTSKYFPKTLNELERSIADFED